MKPPLRRLVPAAFIFLSLTASLVAAKGKKGGNAGESATATNAASAPASNAAASPKTHAAGTNQAAKPAEKSAKSGEEPAARKKDADGESANRLSGPIEALDVPGRKITLGGKTLAIGRNCKVYTLEADGNAYLSDLEKGAEVKVVFSVIDGVATATTIATKEAAAGTAIGMTLGAGEKKATGGKGKKK